MVHCRGLGTPSQATRGDTTADLSTSEQRVGSLDHWGCAGVAQPGLKVRPCENERETAKAEREGRREGTGERGRERERRGGWVRPSETR